MKKVLTGLVTVLSAFGIGKIIYDKGYKDAYKEVNMLYTAMKTGMEISDKANEKKEESK